MWGKGVACFSHVHIQVFQHDILKTFSSPLWMVLASSEISNSLSVALFWVLCSLGVIWWSLSPVPRYLDGCHLLAGCEVGPCTRYHFCHWCFFFKLSFSSSFPPSPLPSLLSLVLLILLTLLGLFIYLFLNFICFYFFIEVWLLQYYLLQAYSTAIHTF